MPGVNTHGTVYLIPSVIEEGTLAAIPQYITEAVKLCQVFFVENERTARRFLKSLWKDMVIDHYEWHAIHKAETEVKHIFLEALSAGKTVGIISEAGCPGVADPGQLLVEAAHEAGAVIKPLVGPSSILLALMASGMNGQHFCFNGYLPVDNIDRMKAIKKLETEALKNNCTQIFIETPYRNNQLLEAIVQSCQASTRLCIAVSITSPEEFIKTKPVSEWKGSKPDIHKKPAIFLLGR